MFALKLYFSCLITDPFPPPSSVQLTSVQKDQLTFSWNAVMASCPAIVYIVDSTGCGTCPNTTVLNTSNCVGYNITEYQSCTFAIQTVVCDDIVSVLSNAVQVALRGTHADISNVIVYEIA